MTWQIPITLTVRFLINDFVEPYKYTDEQIRQMIMIASIYVSADYHFDQEYIIDVEAVSITPDPVDSGDEIFVALVGLKAACLFNINQYQGATLKGIKVKSGDESFDTTSSFRGYSDIISHGPCYSYEMLLKQLRSSGGRGISHGGRAVISLGTNPSTNYGVYTRFYDRVGRLY